MKLENEFMIPAPVERVWPALLDIAQVAQCLPGASIESGQDDGVFRGRMKIKLGPITTVYEGIARLQDVDEDTHTASIAVSAKEAKGQGTASAVITNRLEAVDGSTHVVVGTDLAITGRQAQFGRGIMQDVAARMMGDFAQRFEKQLREGGNAVSEPATVEAALEARAPVEATPDTRAPAEPTPEAEPDAIDLGGILAASPRVRLALAAGLLGLFAAILFAARRNRKEIRLEFRIRP